MSPTTLNAVHDAAPDSGPVEIYRVVYQTVTRRHLVKYCDVDPASSRRVTQTVPNSEIPDEDWHDVAGRPTDFPWGDFLLFRQWEQKDREFVRHVRLERLVVTEPQWQACDYCTRRGGR
jgi:hypothetical protein